MFDRLASMEERYEHLSQLLCRPDVASDPEKLRSYAKEQAELAETVEVYREWKKVSQNIDEAKAMLQDKLDDEMREFVRAELAELQRRREGLEHRLKILLLPKDPNDDKDVFVEIRAAAGGEEAALFAAELLRMYQRYAEKHGWKTEIIDASYTDMGGFREVVMAVHGKGAYAKLKFESGTHRVQRVPVTESGGRIHTSTATVAVLPEVEEVEVEIHEKDLRIDTFCSTGPGGQSVNTTQSAVRITHLPTGIVVSCQDEKSQLKNKEKAMRVLRARLYEKAQREQQEELAAKRRLQVGTGDRSERIRTYNFPQSRVTDHRIGLTLHKLDAVLDGELDEIIQALIVESQAEMLRVREA
ncbi:peptide chain release factor 1 [Alicyclobacillus acidocaldarius]|uniref:Peptide chain release factor 1 n=1 Tax=Alicyclobacillus acidocaldarius subsp. acidocaldarius (strain ATCC 27009 / DSM 446 / BCRC 14685 / JCM 5260 / KCTC 1825 / NBRC 15652 / NCIMB 11725 / NRRL B-14509 / 104-IA) TaxID=521098 RepID=C8WUG8_ALIAD|nr:peptide chain release factor 1 [Alicyclobacillus acidocaldarius]ACV59784.1 peptide chain release factor 1 [Alicyclobacillus acidocaldarius subsp. acidocaldarius DSM 446]